MVTVEELEELRTLLDSLVVAFNQKETASKPLTLSGPHPITGEPVTAELKPLTGKEVERLNKAYKEALKVFKAKAAALKE